MPFSAALLFLGLGCRQKDASYWEYLGEDAGVLERSQASLIRQYEIPLVEDDVVDGFNLDGEVSAAGDQETCGHGDFVNADGVEGVDNQLGRLWGLMSTAVGAAEGLLQGAINEGRFVMAVELSELDDPLNDDNVNLSIYPLDISPEVGTFGLISPNQTGSLLRPELMTTIENLKLENGRVQASGFDYKLPVDVLELQFLMSIQNGAIDLNLTEEGGSYGVLAGALDVEQFLYELHQTDASDEAAFADPLIRTNADMGMVDGECTLFSMTFNFDAVPVYVLRDLSER